MSDENKSTDNESISERVFKKIAEETYLQSAIKYGGELVSEISNQNTLIDEACPEADITPPYISFMPLFNKETLTLEIYCYKHGTDDGNGNKQLAVVTFRRHIKLYLPSPSSRRRSCYRLRKN